MKNYKMQSRQQGAEMKTQVIAGIEAKVFSEEDYGVDCFTGADVEGMLQLAADKNLETDFKSVRSMAYEVRTQNKKSNKDCQIVELTIFDSTFNGGQFFAFVKIGAKK